MFIMFKELLKEGEYELFDRCYTSSFVVQKLLNLIKFYCLKIMSSIKIFGSKIVTFFQKLKFN